MPNLKRLAVGLVVLAMGAPALADGVQVRLRMGFPAILPPLVEVQPGLRVVEDFDEEVFFTGGYYWTQRDGSWYRARDHRGTWRRVRADQLPGVLTRSERGHYRRWGHEEGRSWPDAQHTRSGARHWRATEYRARPAQEGERRQAPSGVGEGDRHGDGRR